MKAQDSKNPIKIPVKQRVNSWALPLKYKIETENEIDFTKKKAFEFLEMKTFEGERTIREHHVQFLFDEWSSGRFLWHNVTLAAARLNGDLYRINGQHTCWMRVNIPDKAEPISTHGVTERIYSVESGEQLRNLYSAFDRAAPRSVGHIQKVMMMDTKATQDIPPSLINKLTSAFKVFFSEDWRRANVNPSSLSGIINQSYCQLFNLVGQFVRLHYEESHNCRRAAVIAAMFSTFEKNIKASEEFWVPVWSNIGHTSKTDPRYKLRVFIDSHTQKPRTSSVSYNMESHIATETLYRVCVNTWNRWRDGSEVATVRTTDKRVKARA
jgi:hypothetical protein